MSQCADIHDLSLPSMNIDIQYRHAPLYLKSSQSSKRPSMLDGVQGTRTSLLPRQFTEVIAADTAAFDGGGRRVPDELDQARGPFLPGAAGRQHVPAVLAGLLDASSQLGGSGVVRHVFVAVGCLWKWSHGGYIGNWW